MSLLSHVLKGFFPISSNSLSVDALRFSTQIIVSFANKEYFISYSPILVFLIFFFYSLLPCLRHLVRYWIEVEIAGCDLISDLKGNVHAVLPPSIMLAIGLLGRYHLSRYGILFPIILVFFNEWMLNFIGQFFCALRQHFFFFNLLIWRII